MKHLLFIALIMLLGILSCNKQEVSSACIDAKIENMRIKNSPYTKVVRYSKDGDYYWLFDTGSAFDAPQYLLNIHCDTVCSWCFCPKRLPCHSEFNLADSTAIIIWQP